VITIKVGLTLLIHSVKHYLKGNFGPLRTYECIGPILFQSEAIVI